MMGIQTARGAAIQLAPEHTAASWAAESPPWLHWARFLNWKSALNSKIPKKNENTAPNMALLGVYTHVWAVRVSVPPISLQLLQENRCLWKFYDINRCGRGFTTQRDVPELPTDLLSRA